MEDKRQLEKHLMEFAHRLKIAMADGRMWNVSGVIHDYIQSLPPEEKKECPHYWVSSVAYKGAKVCAICNTYK